MPDAIPGLVPTNGRTTPQAPPTVAPDGWDISHITFGDVLSAFNPLQYLPVVGTIYREMTGDQGHPALRIAVAAAMSAFLGPAGLAGAMISEVADEVAHHRASPPAAQVAEASSAYRRAARVA